MIEKLNELIDTNDCYVCITRPRRFGKTINANMLGAYYTRGQDNKQLFDRLKIAKEEDYTKHLNQHNVLYLDLSRMPDNCQNYSQYVESIRGKMREDLEETYPDLKKKKYSSLSDMLRDTEDSFIFIIDEWDAVLYKEFMNETDKIEYLGFLKNLLKDQPYVQLTYMTGIIPIVKYLILIRLNTSQLE